MTATSSSRSGGGRSRLSGSQGGDARVHRVAVGGASLNVVDEGPVGAPCVVLLHSILTGADMWRGQLDGLRRLGMRIVRPEVRGHGASTASPAPYDMARLAADVVEVLDALGLDRVHLVGLSLGGSVGLRLAATAPARLRSLVACDARADGPAALAPLWDERIELARTEGMAALIEPTLTRWFGDRLSSTSAERERIGALIRNTAVEGFVGAAQAIRIFDDRSLLAAIRLPTTFVVGSEDGVLPELMADYTQNVGGARLEVIDNAGHLPNVEQPDAFGQALARHIERL